MSSYDRELRQDFICDGIQEDIAVSVDASAPVPYYIALDDIQDVFPTCVRLKNGSSAVQFLKDIHGQRYNPQRIAHHPGVVLTVVCQPPSPHFHHHLQHHHQDRRQSASTDSYMSMVSSVREQDNNVDQVNIMGQEQQQQLGASIIASPLTPTPPPLPTTLSSSLSLSASAFGSTAAYFPVMSSPLPSPSAHSFASNNTTTTNDTHTFKDTLASTTTAITAISSHNHKNNMDTTTSAMFAGALSSPMTPHPAVMFPTGPFSASTVSAATSLETTTSLSSTSPPPPTAISFVQPPTFPTSTSTLTVTTTGTTPLSQQQQQQQSANQPILVTADALLSLQETLLSAQANQTNLLNHQLVELKQEVVLQQQNHHEKVLSMQTELMGLQKQALDRMVVLQKKAEAILVQNYELHEYSIPRLCIILPDTKSDDGLILESNSLEGGGGNGEGTGTSYQSTTGKSSSRFSKWSPSQLGRQRFRLYFLCECGEHTKAVDETISHQIHIASHEGYEIDRPTEFFEQYGSFLLGLLEIFKYGVNIAGLVIPALTHFHLSPNHRHLGPGIGGTAIHHGLKHSAQEIGHGIEYSIEYLQLLSLNKQKHEVLNIEQDMKTAPGIGIEALEGANLRQLGSFLKMKDDGKIWGNLYRTVTEQGHVKWVCQDHYQSSYKESRMNSFRQLVELNSGLYQEQVGKIQLQLRSRFSAKQFYDGLSKSRSIQELNLSLEWDTTRMDLVRLKEALVKTNLISLTIDLDGRQGPLSDILTFGSKRFDPMMELMAHPKIRCIRYKGMPHFYSRCSFLPGDLSHLKELSLDIWIKDQEELNRLKMILEKCRLLTRLEIMTSYVWRHFLMTNLFSMIRVYRDNLNHLGGVGGGGLGSGSRRSISGNKNDTHSGGATFNPGKQTPEMELVIGHESHRVLATFSQQHLLWLETQFEDFREAANLDFLKQHGASLHSLRLLHLGDPTAEVLEFSTRGRSCLERVEIVESYLSPQGRQSLGRVLGRSAGLKYLEYTFSRRNEVGAIFSSLRFEHLQTLQIKFASSECSLHSLRTALDAFMGAPRTPTCPGLESNDTVTTTTTTTSTNNNNGRMMALEHLCLDSLLFSIEDTRIIPEILRRLHHLKSLRLGHFRTTFEKLRTMVEAISFERLESLQISILNKESLDMDLLTELIPRKDYRKPRRKKLTVDAEAALLKDDEYDLDAKEYDDCEFESSSRKDGQVSRLEEFEQVGGFVDDVEGEEEEEEEEAEEEENDDIDSEEDEGVQEDDPELMATMRIAPMLKTKRSQVFCSGGTSVEGALGLTDSFIEREQSVAARLQAIGL